MEPGIPSWASRCVRPPLGEEGESGAGHYPVEKMKMESHVASSSTPRRN
jgi:hypothetical protein